jgi:RNA polymerase sigma-70 factor (ECF subfamily)
MHHAAGDANESCSVPVNGSFSHSLREELFTSPEEFGELLEGCRQYLLVIAEDELGDDLRAKAGASDLVQETFLEAQKVCGDFHGDSRDELLAWLRQILLYRLAKLERRYRGTKKRKVAREWHAYESSQAFLDCLYDSDASTPSGHALRTEKTNVVQQALDRLPADYRTVVLLRHRDHLTFGQIAGRLDRSTDAARMLWCRAIDRLARELEAYDG